MNTKEEQIPTEVASDKLENELVLLKLTKDIKDIALMLDRKQAQMLVKRYYMEQKKRCATHLQVISLGKQVKPTRVLEFFEKQSFTLEKQIAAALKCYAENDPMCQWAMSNKGIGPILAAGLTAFIDIEKAPTVGHIWRLCGNDPTMEWLGKQKASELYAEVVGSSKKPTNEQFVELARRINVKPEFLVEKLGDKSSEDIIKWLARKPWDTTFKTIVWKIGESFVKVCNSEDAYYGRVYLERKAYETAKNEAGEYAEYAAKCLRRNPNHAQRKTYKEGKLPLGHIQSRAKRFAAKRFLADWHAEAYFKHYGKQPPLPYPVAHLGHVHVEVPPTAKSRKALKISKQKQMETV